jgi:hypothetical protein
VWRDLGANVELVIEDDASDPARMGALLPVIASGCDLLLGPYSTQLMRAAAQVLADVDCLIWNQGGSGDDVQAARPGRIVSVLTPTSRYAESFVLRLAALPDRAPLWIVEGRGSFGRQVAAGADALARSVHLDVSRVRPEDPLPGAEGLEIWDMLCAGLFEEDVDTVRRARVLPHPPRQLCAVAAGVRDFGDAVDDPGGVFGIAQWLAGSGTQADLGPTEAEFLDAHSNATGGLPDYPAVQAVAGGVLATRCAQLAGGVAPDALWTAASELKTTTVFGKFGIDRATGVQVEHQAVLVRWSANRLEVVT